MPIQDFLLRLLGITQIIQSWHDALLGLDAGRREKLAIYADEVAATFARAAAAFAALERIPFDKPSRRDAVRELGRISGYLDDIITVLQHAVDGRKLAGVKRRLSHLAKPAAAGLAVPTAARIDSLLDAEGYFRALADGLRAG